MSPHSNPMNYAIWSRDIKFGPKESQIGPKWDKFGTFSNQISIHFGSVSPDLTCLALQDLVYFERSTQPHSLSSKQKITACWKKN